MHNALVSAAILLLSTPAQAGECLNVVFDEPVVSGVPLTVRITIPEACFPSAPPCDFHIAGEGNTAWGDGLVSTWWQSDFLRANQKPPAGALPLETARAITTHAYASPGRYEVITRFHEIFIGQGCPSSSVTHFDTLTIDVLPNPDLIADGWIGTFFDAQGSSCSATVSPGSVIYVIAGLQGLSANGIGAAEFRLRPSAPGFSFGVVNMPGWVRIGDVFGDGVTLAASCDFTRGSNQVVLMKIVVLQAPAVSDVNLFVEKHRTPSNINYNDAKIILCDDPSFTAMDAPRGNVALLNPSAEPTGCAAVPTAVDETTWGRLKGLYRE